MKAILLLGLLLLLQLMNDLVVSVSLSKKEDVNRKMTGRWPAKDNAQISRKLRRAARQTQLLIHTGGSEVDTIEVKAKLSTNELKLPSNNRVIVTAYGLAASQIVRMSNVMAEVEADTGIEGTVLMNDDGIDGDVLPNDNIYSAAIPPASISKAQEYTVRVITGQPNRRVIAGSLLVTKSADGVTVSPAPPNRISDLRYLLNIPTGLVTLTWTAVGDSFSYGIASRYELYISDKFSKVQHADSEAKWSENVTIPLPAGSVQSVNLTINDMPSRDRVNFAGVRAVSASGLPARMSYVVSFMFKLPDLSQFNFVIVADEQSLDANSSGQSNNTSSI